MRKISFPALVKVDTINSVEFKLEPTCKCTPLSLILLDSSKDNVARNFVAVIPKRDLSPFAITWHNHNEILGNMSKWWARTMMSCNSIILSHWTFICFLIDNSISSRNFTGILKNVSLPLKPSFCANDIS